MDIEETANVGRGKHVLLVEDIYDTGATLMTMIEKEKQAGALDVRVCVLLHKKNPKNLQHSYFADYIAFVCP